jgi:hypothetical protein
MSDIGFEGLLAALIFLGLIGIALLAILFLAIADRKNENGYPGFIISAFIPLIVAVEFYFAEVRGIDPIRLTIMIVTSILILLLFAFVGQVKRRLYFLGCLLIAFSPLIAELFGWFTITMTGTLDRFMVQFMAISGLAILILTIMNGIKSKNLYSGYMLAAFIPVIVALIGCLTIDSFSLKTAEALDNGGAVGISILSIFISIVVSVWWKKRKVREEDIH